MTPARPQAMTAEVAPPFLNQVASANDATAFPNFRFGSAAAYG